VDNWQWWIREFHLTSAIRLWNLENLKKKNTAPGRLEVLPCSLTNGGSLEVHMGEMADSRHWWVEKEIIKQWRGSCGRRVAGEDLYWMEWHPTSSD